MCANPNHVDGAKGQQHLIVFDHYMSKAEDSCAETMTYDEDLNLRLLKMFWVRLLMSVFFFQEKGSNHS